MARCWWNHARPVARVLGREIGAAPWTADRGSSPPQILAVRDTPAAVIIRIPRRTSCGPISPPHGRSGRRDHDFVNGRAGPLRSSSAR